MKEAREAKRAASKAGPSRSGGVDPLESSVDEASPSSAQQDDADSPDTFEAEKLLDAKPRPQSSRNAAGPSAKRKRESNESDTVRSPRPRPIHHADDSSHVPKRPHALFSQQ